ncbi:hypothetical protein [Marinobacterium iners]|uniref:Uncharacterized protein n=1 Tax=Marinobacterium iners DSM 11526 TaxID=1122198 RepID=A0A1H4HAA1_9GAMM|nr:hypothetical protein [Marinobacterium iners]SEB18561.1 hypothetical protein SAMN02745729_1356 [Marinobacterium iners DSM 11526]
MSSIHFVERLENIKKVDVERNEWESGFWVVSRENAFKLIGHDIYLHEYQKEPSFLGGKIIGFHIREESNKVVFRFKEAESHKGISTPIEGWGNEQKRVWN